MSQSISQVVTSTNGTAVNSTNAANIYVSNGIGAGVNCPIIYLGPNSSLNTDALIYGMSSVYINDLTGVLYTPSLALASALAVAYGGTAITSYNLGDTLYGNSSNTLSTLTGNTSSTLYLLTQTGTGSVSAAPAWTNPSTITVGNATNVAITNTTSVSGYITFVSANSGYVGIDCDSLNFSYNANTGLVQLGDSNNGTAVNNFTTSIACNNAYGTGSTGVLNTVYVGGYNGGQMNFSSNGSASSQRGIPANSIGIACQDKNFYITGNSGSGSTYTTYLEISNSSTPVLTFYSLFNLQSAGGYATPGAVVSTPTTGTTVTGTNSTPGDIINPSGTLTSLTYKFMTSPVDGQIVRVIFTHIITTLTVSGNTGQSVAGFPASIATAGQGFTAMYVSSLTTWYCVGFA